MSARYVVFTSGYRNRFKHPRPVIKHRYELTGAEIYSSAEHGAIQFVLDKDSPVSSPHTYRQLNRRHWHRVDSLSY